MNSLTQNQRGPCPQPKLSETTIVFRDSSFVDDMAKSNVAAILVQAGFDETRIRSL